MSHAKTIIKIYIHLTEFAAGAWEVCNQVDSIYTVIRSKAPAIMKNWIGCYCMIGPYINRNIQAELEPLDDAADIFGLAANNLKKKGYNAVYAACRSLEIHAWYYSIPTQLKKRRCL